MGKLIFWTRIQATHTCLTRCFGHLSFILSFFVTLTAYNKHRKSVSSRRRRRPEPQEDPLQLLRILLKRHGIHARTPHTHRARACARGFFRCYVVFNNCRTLFVSEHDFNECSITPAIAWPLSPPAHTHTPSPFALPKQEVAKTVTATGVPSLVFLCTQYLAKNIHQHEEVFIEHPLFFLAASAKAVALTCLPGSGIVQISHVPELIRAPILRLVTQHKELMQHPAKVIRALVSEDQARLCAFLCACSGLSSISRWCRPVLCVRHSQSVLLTTIVSDCARPLCLFQRWNGASDRQLSPTPASLPPANEPVSRY